MARTKQRKRKAKEASKLQNMNPSSYTKRMALEARELRNSSCHESMEPSTTSDPSPNSDEHRSELVIPNTPNLMSLDFIAQSAKEYANKYDKHIDRKFRNGEKVLCCTIISPLLVEAKCQWFQVVQNTHYYLIHYMNWHKTWNEWVPESKILDMNSENLIKMKKLRSEYPLDMLCANLLQCLEKNYQVKGGYDMIKEAISNLENCNITLEVLPATQLLIKHIINFNIALKSFITKRREFCCGESENKQMLFAVDLLSRTENLVKKWRGILNSTGLASFEAFEEPSNPENLPQLVTASESVLPKKRRVKRRVTLKTENEELKNLVEHLKTKVENLTKENSELKQNYGRIEVKNEQLLTEEEIPTFEHESTYLDDEIKKEIKIERLESVRKEELTKNDIEIVDCENKKPSDKKFLSDQKFENEELKNLVERLTKENSELKQNYGRIEVKNEQLHTEDEIPTFEHESTYLDDEIKKEIIIEPLEFGHHCQPDQNRWLTANNGNIAKATNVSLISVKREEELTKNDVEIVDYENKKPEKKFQASAQKPIRFLSPPASPPYKYSPPRKVLKK